MLTQPTDRERDEISKAARNALADVIDTAGDLALDDFSTRDEHYNTDRYQLEKQFTDMALQFLRAMQTFRVEREFLKQAHDEIAAEVDHWDRENSSLGYGHQQHELV